MDIGRAIFRHIRPLTLKVLALDAEFRAAKPRHIALALTDVAVGASTTTVTIDPPMTSTYGLALTPIAGLGIAGKLTATIQPLSKTATGFTAVLSNTSPSIITAAGLDVIVVPD